MPLLDVRNISIRFGGLLAVDGFTMTMEKNDIYGLIGPNGAGKTTVFNMLTGVYRPTSGTIRLGGRQIAGKRPYDITKMGISRTFQNIRLMRNLTVLENVKVSFLYQMKCNLAESILRLPRYWKEEKIVEEKSMALLRAFHLEEKKDELAANLPYGEQRRLEIARALATQPKLLLLDEPAAGMNPQETQELAGLIRWVRKKFDIAILLIEHDMRLVMNVCEKIVVLDYGRIIAQGLPEEIRNDPKVIEAYLGEEASHA